MHSQSVKVSRRRRRSGVTLAEAVVASALLLIAIVPLLKALTAAQVMDRVVERKSWSLMLAQRELERVRAQCLYHYDESCRRTSAVVQDGYLCTVADDGDSALRMIAVSVGFDADGDGALSSGEIAVRLCTRVARRRPGPS